MATFIELTVLYHSQDVDPRAPYNRSEKRLFNLDEVEFIYSHGEGCGVQTHQRLVPVGETYEYLVSVLTAWQPRPLGEPMKMGPPPSSNGGPGV